MFTLLFYDHSVAPVSVIMSARKVDPHLCTGRDNETSRGAVIIFILFNSRLRFWERFVIRFFHQTPSSSELCVQPDFFDHCVTLVYLIFSVRKVDPRPCKFENGTTNLLGGQGQFFLHHPPSSSDPHLIFNYFSADFLTRFLFYLPLH